MSADFYKVVKGPTSRIPFEVDFDESGGRTLPEFLVNVDQTNGPDDLRSIKQLYSILPSCAPSPRPTAAPDTSSNSSSGGSSNYSYV